jgi:hypothetical protein
MTAISVASCSKVARDLLKSFSCGMGRSIDSLERRWCHCPNISPKGSMVVFDDDHLAYWERSKKQALENLSHDKRVCVICANFKAQLLRSHGSIRPT